MKTAVQTAFFMAVLTLVSKCIGFVREMVMAAFFGTSYITDAYVMATAIPSILFAGIFGAVATSYMPLFSEKAELEGEKEANLFTSQVINLLLIISILSSVIGIIFSDQIVMIFASGFHGETAKLTSFFVKVTFSYIIFTSTTGILEANLQYKGVFLPQIVVGYLQNFILIAAIVISGYTSHYYLAFGYLIAYFIRFIMIGRLTIKKGFSYIPTIKVGETTKSIALLAFPVFVGSSIGQINLFVDKWLASGLPEGSVAALNYGNIIIALITGLTISILITVIYPKLARASSTGDDLKFNDIAETGVTLISIISIPCTFGALIYSEQVVQIIYERGAFDPLATAMTGSAFFYYAVGMTFAAVNGLLVYIYYARHDMKTPLILGVPVIIINIVLNLILVQSMNHNGLALATSIANMSSTVLLYYGMRKKYPEIKIIKSKKKLVLIVFSAGLSVLGSLIFYRIIEGTIWMPRMILFGFAVIIAAGIYYLLLQKFQIEEVKLLSQIIANKSN